MPYLEEDWRGAALLKRPLAATGNIRLQVNTLYCKKYPYICGYFVASFPYFNGTGSVYTIVPVNRWNNEARGPHLGQPGFIIPSIYGYKHIRNQLR